MHFYSWRWTEAIEAFSRAVEARRYDIDAQVLYLNSYLERFDVAVGLAEQAIRLNPGNAFSLALLGYVQHRAGDYESAADNLRTALASIIDARDRGVVMSWLTQVEVARRNEAEALRLLDEIAQNDINAGIDPYRAGNSYQYALLGRPEPAEQALARLEADSANRDLVGAGQWAMAYLGVRDAERALEWLEIGAAKARLHEPDQTFFQLMGIKMNDLNDPLLERPEFSDVRRRLHGD
jgi:tetratricopeptide (TPR) repeat protein